MRSAPVLSLVACLALSASSPQGKVFHTAKEGLRLAFGADAQIERKSVVLTEAQVARIERRSGTKLRSKVIRYYVATKSTPERRDGKKLDKKQKGESGTARSRHAGENVLLGTAYFDVHRVRTMREVLLVAVTPDHRVQETRVMSFGDPVTYIPPKDWYAQLHGRKLDAKLQLHRGIDGFSGATLTARATTRCARRVLAIHAELSPKRKGRSGRRKARKKRGK